MSSEGAKNPRMMGYRSVAKCARCGAPVDGDILSLSKCEKCSQALHACIQCLNFDPARVSWERETSSTPVPASPTASGMPESVSDAKKAFEDLFKI